MIWSLFSMSIIFHWKLYKELNNLLLKSSKDKKVWGPLIKFSLQTLKWLGMRKLKLGKGKLLGGWESVSSSRDWCFWFNLVLSNVSNWLTQKWDGEKSTGWFRNGMKKNPACTNFRAGWHSQNPKCILHESSLNSLLFFCPLQTLPWSFKNRHFFLMWTWRWLFYHLRIIWLHMLRKKGVIRACEI